MPIPIALFAYNRPQYLRQTLEALRQCPEAKDTLLYVFCDAPRSAKDEAPVAAVHAILSDIQGFHAVEVKISPVNRGLANSLMAGITEVLGKHDSAIVMEDDLVVAPHFLRYLNQAVACYKDHPGVAGIHAHCRNVRRPLPETYFLFEPGSWGWATWRSSWAHMRPDARELLAEIKQRRLQRLFDFNYSYNFTAMLEKQIRGEVDSWAIRWYASNLLAGRLSLHPGRNLVRHIGVDQGTHFHGGKGPELNAPLTGEPVEVASIPVELSREAYAVHNDFYLAQRRWLMGIPVGRLRVGLKSFLLP